MADEVYRQKEKKIINIKFTGMKPRFTYKDVFVFLTALTPLIYLAIVYDGLNNTVPVHFNLEGKADSFGNKSTLWLAVITLAVSAILVYLLLKFIPLIDPKKKAVQSSAVYQKIAFATAILLTGIGFLIIQSAKTGSFYSSNFMFAGLGLLFAFIGNLMYSIKPNYFAGIRTPWTLEDEDTWRKTHQLASRIWVAGGIALSIFAIVLPIKILIIVFYSIMGVMVLIPVIYSYTYYKKHHKQNT